MASYDSIDISFSWDGDFELGKDGDLKDTSDDLIQALLQEIRSIIKSEFGDWKEHVSYAAGLSEYRGEPNTRKVGESIEQRVRSVLVSNNVVRPEDLDVRVVPVHIHQILIMIKIRALATPNNSLVLGQPIVTSLVYDSVEDSIWYVTESQKERNYFFR